jgi:hypothetical protein
VQPQQSRRCIDDVARSRVSGAHPNKLRGVECLGKYGGAKVNSRLHFFQRVFAIERRRHMSMGKRRVSVAPAARASGPGHRVAVASSFSRVVVSSVPQARPRRTWRTSCARACVYSLCSSARTRSGRGRRKVCGPARAYPPAPIRLDRDAHPSFSSRSAVPPAQHVYAVGRDCACRRVRVHVHFDIRIVLRAPHVDFARVVVDMRTTLGALRAQLSTRSSPRDEQACRAPKGQKGQGSRATYTG